jgi:preprotein translocase subunit YajC
VLNEVARLLAEGESPSPAAAPGGLLGGNWIMIVMLVGLGVVFWFMSRRNRKAQTKTEEYRRSLTVGTRVMTVGGLIGTITNVQGDVITLRSVNGDESEYVRRAIRETVDDEMWGNMTDPYPVDEDEPEQAADQADETPEPPASDDDNPPGVEKFGK